MRLPQPYLTQGSVKFRVSELVFFFLAVGIILNALAAYDFLDIPFPWFANVVFITNLLLALSLSRLAVPPSFGVLVSLFVWTLFVTLGNDVSSRYAVLMPVAATTAYPVFVLLRFLELGSFIAVVWVVYAVCRRGYQDRLFAFIVQLGTCLSLVALYMYFAQLNGWPEPFRNRLGTGGSQYGVTVFTYAFHRAVGTFREPSHLAVWLLVPLFISMGYKRKFVNVHTAVMLLVLLLTGSLTGILALGCGLFGAVVLYRPLAVLNGKTYLGATALLVLAINAFYLVAQNDTGNPFSMAELIGERLHALVTDPVSGTNRSYVYEFVVNSPPAIWGYGAGNGNIILANAVQSPLPTSFLNLFLNAAYNTGVVGLLLTFLLLLIPIVRLWSITSRGLRSDEDTRWLLGAYVGWIIAFMGESEVMPPIFGVLYGILLFRIYRSNQQPMFV